MFLANILISRKWFIYKLRVDTLREIVVFRKMQLVHHKSSIQISLYVQFVQINVLLKLTCDICIHVTTAT